MKKQPLEKIQLRYYDVPKTSYVLALIGESWIRHYGHGIDFSHFHNVLEIGYCHSGEGEMVFKKDSIPYFQNEFTIIPPNYPHTTNSNGNSYWEYLFVDVEGFLASEYPTNPRLRNTLTNRIYSDAILQTDDAYPRIGNLIQEIIHEYREKNEFYIESVKGYLKALLLEIARMQAESNRIPELQLPEHFPQIWNALKYMEDHYTENIKTQELADACNLSETHFRRLFQEKMNCTPQEYLIRIRIHFACTLLQDENVGIEEAATKCGYISMSTFNRNFRKVMKMSPKQWRQEGALYTVDMSRYSVMVEDGWN